MNAAYFTRNRIRFYEKMEPDSLLILFSGVEIRRTNDEFYPFHAERNFVYLTGLTCKEAVFLAQKDSSGAVNERLYILPPDFMVERWTGRRVKPYEAEAVSGIRDIRYTDAFQQELIALLSGDAVEKIYEDFEALFPQCREVTERYRSIRGGMLRIWQCVLRLFAPLL